MTVTTTPAPPRRLLSGECREVEQVRLAGRFVGTIEVDKHGEWWARPAGWPYPVPTAFGLRVDALAALERLAGRPGSWLRKDVPEELRIARAEEANDATD